MITDIAQRWTNRRESYRRRGEAFDPSLYEVAPIKSDKVARAFVEAHHYLGTFPAARERYGLYTGGELVGVAVYSVPCHPNVIANWFPFEWRAGVELGRFVLLDSCPYNSESWFLARTRELLTRAGYLGIVSFADDLPRALEGGGVSFRGHVGTIYQASNAVLAGRGRGQSLLVLPNGKPWHRRNRGKVIHAERGHENAALELVKWGAKPFAGRCESTRRAWLEDALAAVTTPLKHPGCLRYLWGLNRRVRRFLPKTDPYPKLGALERQGALAA
jgi:hypothetical protein